MVVTDYRQAIATLLRVHSATFRTKSSEFYGTFNGYECAGDSERDCGCIYVISSPINKLVWEDEFISLEVPDEA